MALLHADVHSVGQMLSRQLTPGKSTGLRQLLSTFEIEGMFRQLRQRMRHERALCWNANTVRRYCELCGVNEARLTSSQRALLRALLNRAAD
ncbi:hypothetical protein HA44_18630 [Mixta gaviniae]|nr:hypothetical protein HA44_18630 [Mixta gaviniae]